MIQTMISLTEDLEDMMMVSQPENPRMKASRSVLIEILQMMFTLHDPGLDRNLDIMKIPMMIGIK
jgi:hypothetical protein